MGHASETPARRPSRKPTHPGAVLRDTYLPATGQTVAQAAERLGVGRTHLHKVVAERCSVTPDMAHRLGKLIGNGPDLWINMQVAHDMWVARERLGDALDAIPTVGSEKA